MHGQPGFLGTEESLEDPYLSSGSGGRIAYGLLVEVLLELPIDMFRSVHYIILPSKPKNR
jgi:hypothetical protein